MTTHQDDDERVQRDATPRIRAPRIPKPALVPETVHRFHDVDKRRHKLYNAACPACRLDDKNRMMAETPQVPDEDLYKTIFMVPDYAPERRICELYIERRYPRAVNVGSSLNYQLVPQMPEIQIVVVCRRRLDGREKTQHVRNILGHDNKWREEQIPLLELVPEVLESGVLVVGEAVEVTAGSLIAAVQVDTNELVERLADIAPGYRIFRQNPPDQLIVLQAE